MNKAATNRITTRLFFGNKDFLPVFAGFSFFTLAAFGFFSFVLGTFSLVFFVGIMIVLM